MRRLAFLRVCFCALALCLSGVPQQSSAQDYARLYNNFNSRDLTYAERRYLQAALAFEGHYLGLLDGDWGKLSRRAMSQYSWRAFDEETKEWHIAALAFSFFDKYESDGWEMRYFSGLDMSLLVPEKRLIADPPSENFANFRHSGSSLSFSIGIHTQAMANSIHRYTLDLHSGRETPYTVRKRNFAVSSARLADGSYLYSRSNFRNGAWSTVMVSAASRDQNTFNAVTSSITIGRSPRLDITQGGKLMDVIGTTLALLEERTDSVQGAPRQSASKPAQVQPSGSSGSGFVVSDNGHVLSNAHVVKGCGIILVDGVRATLLDASADFDLALLKTSRPLDKSVAVFSAKPAKLNSDVTVVGYPYAGFLGGVNVTRGSVSSLRGVGGDANTLQITAPVQSGNSGGPLVAADGEVVGVVVSKLDAMKIAERGGDLPQNVNFAVRGAIAKLFLAQNQIEPVLSLDDEVLAPEVLAEQVSGFTTFIECKP